MERLRKGFTLKRPHRCRACGWRGWRLESSRLDAGEGSAVEREAPDFGAIDGALTLEREERRQARG